MAVETALAKYVGSALAKRALTSIGRALDEFHRAKGERAVAALVSALCELDGLPPEEAAERLDALLTSAEPGVKDAHETLYETFRSLAGTRTEAAWPYIARLTARALTRGGIDTTFRRAAWLLERCEAEDVAMLVEAARISRELMTDPDPEVVGVVWSGEDYADSLGIEYQQRPYGFSVNAAIKTGLDAVRPARLVPGGFRGADVLRLVEDARLARKTNHERIFISRKHVENLAEVFASGT